MLRIATATASRFCEKNPGQIRPVLTPHNRLEYKFLTPEERTYSFDDVLQKIQSSGMNAAAPHRFFYFRREYRTKPQSRFEDDDVAFYRQRSIADASCGTVTPRVKLIILALNIDGLVDSLSPFTSSKLLQPLRLLNPHRWRCNPATSTPELLRPSFELERQNTDASRFLLRRKI